MTTQTAAYNYTIKFPGTNVSTQVTDANEVSLSKKGIYTYKLEAINIQVFDSTAISGSDKHGQKHINYSESVGETSIVKEDENGELMARYKNKFYPVSVFVCGYVAQPCIYI